MQDRTRSYASFVAFHPPPAIAAAPAVLSAVSPAPAAPAVGAAAMIGRCMHAERARVNEEEDGAEEERCLPPF